MGYTHYYPRKVKEIDDVKAWKDFIKDTQQLLKYAKTQMHIGLSSNHPSNKIIPPDKSYINFNGVGDYEHETFEIEFKHSSDRDFLFTKTARKPYDLCVCATLLLLHHHLPKIHEISSDGDSHDWLPAVKLNHQLFGYGTNLPPSIHTDSEYDNFIQSFKAVKEKEVLAEETENSNIKKNLVL